MPSAGDATDQIYNLAAQSHVQVSFETPEYTANTDALGALRLLEAIRILRMDERAKFYQASTSELYGKAQEKPQRETTPFYPRSPYAAAKLYAYWITVNYREAYGIHASNGILFNHESPTRGETFVGQAAHRVARGGDRIEDTGIDKATGTDLIRVDPRYFRPTEVDDLVGDASKAARQLGWMATTSFGALVTEMVQSDSECVANEAGRKDRGSY